MTITDHEISGTALLTGASGFIGGHLREALLNAGAEVVAVRRPSSPEPDEGRSIVVDYADEEGVAKALEEVRPDWVFHVAGATKGVRYEDFQRANVMPTRHLLAGLERARPPLRRFVLVSSLACYGPSSPAQPLTESDPRQPVEHYGRSKLEAEQVLEAMGDAVPWTIIRPSGVYGPADREYFNLFREASKGRNVFFGNRDRWFSVVYVDDCVRAILDVTLSDSTVGRGYFICDGEPITWGRFQQLIVDSVDRRVFTVNLPEVLVPLAAVGGELATLVDKKPRLFNRQKAKMGAQEAWTCRHDAAREDFGYAPAVPVEDGVPQTMGWYRDAGWL